MKKLILIFLLIFAMLLSACTAGNGISNSLDTDNAETPSPTYEYELFVDVFKSDNSIRNLFKVIAEESLSITEGKTFQLWVYLHAAALNVGDNPCNIQICHTHIEPIHY